jgi:hypothetical protein
MALIFKVANEQIVPTWYKDGDGLSQFNGEIAEAEANRVIALPKDVDTEALSKELDIIEARGKTGEAYHYSSSWNAEAKSTIREYAILSGCKVFEVNPEDEGIQAYASLKKQEGLQKTASVATVSPENSLQDTFLIDAPFQKDDTSNPYSELKKGGEKAKYLQPSVEMRGVTVARASSSQDDDNIGIAMKPSAGKNSLQDPDAIGRAIQSKSEDLGERLRREKEERKQIKEAQRKSAQKALDKEMEETGYGAVAHGNFRLSEAPSVQGGVFGSLSRRTETSEGEKIVIARKAKEQVVEAQKAEAKKQWNHLSGSSKPRISDDLANALKAELGKIE